MPGKAREGPDGGPGTGRPLGRHDGAGPRPLGQGAHGGSAPPRDKGNAGPGADDAARAAGGRSRRQRWLFGAYTIFRRVALLGPTREEIARMEREDREANTDWLPGGKYGVEHIFLEYGARRSPEELAEARAEDEAYENDAAHGMQGGRSA